MHFGAVVLIPEETPVTEDAITDAVEHLLEPYYIEREGLERKEYFTADEIRFLTRQFWLRPKSLPKLAETLRRKWGMDCGVDEDGLYHITALNPEGKFDYFALFSGEDVIENRVEARIQESVWPVTDIPRDLAPSAVVTPDGAWHDTGSEKWAWQLSRSEQDTIRARAYAIIEQYPTHLAVMVDCHI